MPKVILIYLEFLRMSLLSFGSLIGVLPEMERIFVDTHHWIDSKEFYQTYAIGQFLPGPNMAMCPVLGYKIGGYSGALAAYMGILTGPIILMVATFFLLERGNIKSQIRRLDHTLRPIVLGLSFAGILKLFWIQINQSQLGIWGAFPAASLMVGILGYFQLRKWLAPLFSLFVGATLWFLIEFAPTHF